MKTRTENPEKKVELDEKGKPLDAEAAKKSNPAHQGEQPEGNGATGKPAAFPPHN